MKSEISEGVNGSDTSLYLSNLRPMPILLMGRFLLFGSGSEIVLFFGPDVTCHPCKMLTSLKGSSIFNFLFVFKGIL